MTSPALSMLWFVAVVVAIPFVLWLLKRSAWGQALGSGNAGVAHTVSTLALSPSQKVTIVEVGNGEARQWLVLGVTPQQITPLHTLPPQDLPPQQAVRNTGGFAAALQRARQRRTS